MFAALLGSTVYGSSSLFERYGVEAFGVASSVVDQGKEFVLKGLIDGLGGGPLIPEAGACQLFSFRGGQDDAEGVEGFRVFERDGEAFVFDRVVSQVIGVRGIEQGGFCFGENHGFMEGRLVAFLNILLDTYYLNK